ncbi:uncharacterized protein LOC133340479 isoform X2 [Lethenteron reissneri]|uniref:uncharacterized protein LOC133340479 isoform X2 n=1 Tax=Lethenteron reissneri TaxID=7753 RepID=UPI002AB7BC98|nr:uncharacterized protein LOC133340479 isoform X2 [Lethenteron reissneri]
MQGWVSFARRDLGHKRQAKILTMAMQLHFVSRDTHNRGAITALGYHPCRREILTGHQDGVIKWWESETGRLLLTSSEHQGWVTHFVFWHEAKLLLSSSNDGSIVAWSAAATLLDRMQVGSSVYCMAGLGRWQKLACGTRCGLRAVRLSDGKGTARVLDSPASLSVAADKHGAAGVVCCMASNDSRLYTGGYGGTLAIYDVSSPAGESDVSLLHCNPRAHDAGITCLALPTDDRSTWLLTGSFDRTVRLWSREGQPLQRLGHFLSAVTGLCYVPSAHAAWALSGACSPVLIDLRSGESVSEFVDVFSDPVEATRHRLQLLAYLPELGQVVASTSRRQLLVWKFVASGCLTALRCLQPVESLAYTRKAPMLIFSGLADGSVMKWERLQSSHFIYSCEKFPLPGTAKNLVVPSSSRQRPRRAPHGGPVPPGGSDGGGGGGGGTPRRPVTAPGDLGWTRGQRQSSRRSVPGQAGEERHSRNVAITRAVFVEERDLLVLACEDGRVYVWGFDETGVSALQRAPGWSPDEATARSLKRFAVLLSEAELRSLMKTLRDNGEDRDSVTNRVAGFVCKSTLCAHTACVSAIVVVGPDGDDGTTYLVSGGWDRRLCVWRLEEGALHDTFLDTAPGTPYGEQEIACDGVIMDMAFSPKRREFAYASSDGAVRVRAFRPCGPEMELVATLTGHEAEATCVRWHGVTERWVTASQDGTVRVWSGDGSSCERVLVMPGAVGALCIDELSGCIVVGVQNTLRVFDAETFTQVQVNTGHSDCVRSIIHIPERGQYVSAGWDRTVRVWNAYHRGRAGPSRDNCSTTPTLQRGTPSRAGAASPHAVTPNRPPPPHLVIP